MKLIQINKNTGEKCVALDSYVSFDDPEEEIEPIITKLTGITDEMVKGQSIDWNSVKEILSKSDLILSGKLPGSSALYTCPIFLDFAL